MISQAPGKVVLRNFEGYITTYNEPNDYTGHTVARPEEQLAKPARGQEGISGLLSGDADYIKPQGFDTLHARGREEALPFGPLDWQVATPESVAGAGER
jgi:lysine 2,3-aminomutase